MTALAAVLVAALATARPASGTGGDAPIPFEENQGQAEPAARYLARAGGTTLLLLGDEAVFALADRQCPGSPLGLIRMRPAGSPPGTGPVGLDVLPGRVHDLRGNDPACWRRDIPTYRRVAYRDVWPGVDLIFHGDRDRLEYDLVLGPGASRQDLRLRFTGAERIRVEGGDLLLEVAGAELRQSVPQAWEEAPGAPPRPVVMRWRAAADGEVALEVGAHDPERTLVVDPVLAYATYLGGAADDRDPAIAVDAAGSVYVTGWVESANYPLGSTPLQGALLGSADAVVTKLDPAGNALVFSTYLGGSSQDFGTAVAIDSAGNVVVGGRSVSLDFPLVNPLSREDAGFLSKLLPDGSGFVFSTFLGRNFDGTQSLALDAADDIHVTGRTHDGYATVNAFQPTYGGGFYDALAIKVEAGGTGLVYATYLGGSGDDTAFGVAASPAGETILTGRTDSDDFPIRAAHQATRAGLDDIYVTKLDVTGQPVFSTYLGGGDTDWGRAAASDASGRAYIAGETLGGFPLVNPMPPGAGANLNCVLAVFDPSGVVLTSTAFGGNGSDRGLWIGVDGNGDVLFAGLAGSADFPQLGSVQPFRGSFDAFLVKITPNFVGPSFTLAYSTLLGGSGYENYAGGAIGPDGAAYLVADTQSTDLTVLDPYQASSGGGRDFFVAKIAPMLHVGMAASDPEPVLRTRFDLTIPVENLDAADATGVVTTTAFPPCLDLTAFDPMTQVAVTDPAATVSYDAPARTLEVRFAGGFTRGRREAIRVTGIVAGSGAGRCCLGTSIIHDTDQNGFNAGTCVEIRCAAPAPAVAGLQAVRLGNDVRISWDVAADPDLTARYNLWAVIGDKAEIPAASATAWASRPAWLLPACLQVPRLGPACTDAGVLVSPPAPPLLFYSVRGACGDGREGF